MDLLPRGESACYRCSSGRRIGDFEPFSLSAQHMKRLVPNRSAVASPNADISDLWCSLEVMTGKRARLEPNT